MREDVIFWEWSEGYCGRDQNHRYPLRTLYQTVSRKGNRENSTERPVRHKAVKPVRGHLPR